MGGGRHPHGRRSLGRLATVLAVVVLAAGAGMAKAAVTGTAPVVAVSATDDTWAQQILPSAAEVGGDYAPDALAVDETGADSSSSPGCLSAPFDESDLTLTADRSSSFGGTADRTIDAEVQVWQTADFAQAAWDRETPGFVACVAEGLRAASDKKSTVHVLGSATKAFAAVAPRTAAWTVQWEVVVSVKVRVKQPAKPKKLAKPTKSKKKKKKKPAWKVEHVHVPAVTDLVVLGNGRASAFLAFTQVGQVGTSVALEQSIASAMATRMASDPAPPAQP